MLNNVIHSGGIRAIYAYNGSVFDGMALPAGIERQDVIDRIFFKHGDAPLMYPDPTVMQFYISSWSRRKLPMWNKLLELATADYNPLENYDRMEETTDSGKDVSTNTSTGKVSAENMDDFLNSDQTVDNGSVDSTSKRVSRIHGNIGVMTSQQMYNAQYDILMSGKMDVIDSIADDFHKEFCMEVY